MLVYNPQSFLEKSPLDWWYNTASPTSSIFTEETMKFSKETSLYLHNQASYMERAWLCPASAHYRLCLANNLESLQGTIKPLRQTGVKHATLCHKAHPQLQIIGPSSITPKYLKTNVWLYLKHPPRDFLNPIELFWKGVQMQFRESTLKLLRQSNMRQNSGRKYLQADVEVPLRAAQTTFWQYLMLQVVQQHISQGFPSFILGHAIFICVILQKYLVD